MTRLALFVGNSHYDDPKLAQLKTPAADVRSLAAAFRDPNIGGFDEVIELIDESEAAIRRRISTFFDRRQSNDLLLCYFSGHGVRDDRGRLYLAARDTSLDQLKATGIPSSYLVEHMDECRSRRQILILDCCNSGAFAHGTKGSPTVMTRDTFEGNGFGRVVLTASDATQYAFEGDRIIEQAELSLFTHYLLEGLSTGAAAPGGDEHITLDQWYDYAYGRVLGQTRTQTPRKWVYNQEGALIIAKNPRPRPPGADLPQSVRDAGRDDRAEVRRGAVTELIRIARTSDGRYRQAAIAALEVLAARDGNQTVRASAAEALGNLEPAPASAEPAPPASAAKPDAAPASPAP
ncbi:MAG: caspase family protein, partial [Gemmatimonadetes bacterium]|nr:caspase family protein [Gemmatimonadota bacterium]